ncbi:hypothetical protein F511_05637 [Dorcoceras hygrometricum]|uniref:Acyl-CoA dehydrogenase-related protein n=1 Tax=Dorcoceras hygrometricum TaxID=472368 RepID=A0A2Z7D2C1_9LAMI|nr:hypothetical protein F511_05637 [Dorcoceras hygrometricum]
MSLFDLQDVCIAIGSLATLDLPMVVDLIGIYGLKGPYCTLTMTDWFLQALSVIPRGSWGDVARRFTMIRWAGLLVQADEGTLLPVVDLIDDLQPPTDKSQFPCDSGWSQAPRRQQVASSRAIPAASYSSAPPAASYSSAQISRCWTTSRNIQTTTFPSRSTVMLTRVDICFD